MKAKVAYLVDDNCNWDNEHDWKFYEEKDVPEWRLSERNTRRIIYFEVE